jgi:hypothetical protein
VAQGVGPEFKPQYRKKKKKKKAKQNKNTPNDSDVFLQANFLKSIKMLKYHNSFGGKTA